MKSLNQCLPPARIGVIGSGFVSKGFVMALDTRNDMAITKILTRTEISDRADFPKPELLTNSIDELISHSDVVVECSGDVVHATEIINQVMLETIPVITMDSELQVTTGSYFARLGFITEAEGDQPGSLAALRENVIQMGFKPLVYGNIKGFLNLTPTISEMKYWARKQNISLDKVTSFTDGSKLQIEQALVAKPGLVGIKTDDLNSGASILAKHAIEIGYPISDYILSSILPPGVFIAAEHEERQKDYLKYYKLGNGPFYVLLQPYHLSHLEIVKTIRRVFNGGGVLLNNGENPTISVAAVAKKRLNPGEKIKKGIGSFAVRGSAVMIDENRSHVPIGLLSNAVITKRIEAGELINFDVLEIPDSLALRAWQEVVNVQINET
jgi:predicted homoserine dehydrogenase-like protein